MQVTNPLTKQASVAYMVAKQPNDDTAMPANTIQPRFSAFGDVDSVFEVSQPLSMPLQVPPHFLNVAESLDDWEEPTFDPTIHLAIEPPRSITLLDFSEVKETPPIKGNAQSPLAYTSAFRLLSEEGVTVLRRILERNQRLLRTCQRIPSFIRGMAYTSRFIRDLNESPVVLEALSRFAGQKLLPHYLGMNYSHTNFGRLPKPGTLLNEIPVDQWHTDSVPFVLIIILSDLSGMVGGELQCIRRKGRAAGFELIERTQNHVDAADLLNVSYEKKGYALFMQGSEIVHHVTSVQSAIEPRITMVNSYMPANCFADDRTVYATFIDGGSEKEAILEFARGRAWRAANQLNALVAQSPYTEDPNPLINHLSRVVSELQMTVDLLSQRANDAIGFYDEVSSKKRLDEQLSKMAGDAKP